MTFESKVIDQGEHLAAWNPQILENRVFMMIPITFDPHSGLDEKGCNALEIFSQSLEKLSGNNFIDALGCIGIPFPRPYGMEAESSAMWVDLTGQAVRDFHPFIRQVVNANCEGVAVSRPKRIAHEQTLSQVNGGKKRIFHLLLGEDAQRRCGCRSLALQLKTPRIYGFASGTAILAIEWKYLPQQESATNSKESIALNAAAVMEGNSAVSHGREKNGEPLAKLVREDGGVEIVGEGLAAIAAALLPAHLRDQIAGKRRFVYSGLRVRPGGDRVPEIERLALVHRLAHRQTLFYSPDQVGLQNAKLRPFSNVLHGAAIEGGCTLVEADDKSPEALRKFIGNQLGNTYLPLLVSSLHAYFWLLAQTEVIPQSFSAINKSEEAEHLESLQNRLINFRRFFHFSLASEISQHNEFYHLWQRVLMIETQLSTLSMLAREIGEKVSERRVKWIGYLSGAVGGLVIGREIIEVIRDKATMNFYEWSKLLLLDSRTAENVQKVEVAIQNAEFWEWVAVVGAVAGGIIGLVVTWYFGLKAKR